MASMIETVVKTVLSKTMKEEYSHMMLPGAMFAVVESVKDCGSYYEYILRIIDENKMPVKKYPELPQVKSKLNIEAGKTVAVVMIAGRLDAYILGEAVI